MTPSRVEMTPGAREDLLAEARYVADVSKLLDLAQAWLDGIRQAVMGLADLPQSFPPGARERRI